MRPGPGRVGPGVRPCRLAGARCELLLFYALSLSAVFGHCGMCVCYCFGFVREGVRFYVCPNIVRTPAFTCLWCIYECGAVFHKAIVAAGVADGLPFRAIVSCSRCCDFAVARARSNVHNDVSVDELGVRVDHIHIAKHKHTI